MPRKSDPVLREIWKDRLRRCSESSLSAAEFCCREDICISLFYYWRNKSTAAPEAELGGEGTPAFLPVRLTDAAAAAATIRLPGGAVIELPASLAPEQLTQWLAACIRAAGGETSEVNR